MKTFEQAMLESMKRGPRRLNCGEEFDVFAEFSVSVAQCGNYTDTENDKMMNGIMREWQAKAQILCDAIGMQCLTPTAVDVRQEKNECQDGVWHVKMKITSKCTP